MGFDPKEDKTHKLRKKALECQRFCDLIFNVKLNKLICQISIQMVKLHVYQRTVLK